MHLCVLPWGLTWVWALVLTTSVHSALAAPKTSRPVTLPATVLIGTDFGNGRYVFDVPQRLADCPKDIEARAYTAYAEALQKWRADKLALPGSSLPKPVNLSALTGLNLTAPKDLKALADGTWVPISLTATATATASKVKPLNLLPYVAANESYTPCWVLGTVHWSQAELAPTDMTWAIASRSPTTVRTLEGVAKSVTWDSVTTRLQAEFAQLVTQTPALANRLQTLFSDSQGRAMDWKLIAAQPLTAKYQGKPTNFWSATVLVDSGHTLTMIVNATSRELCWWHAGTEDEMEDKTVLALAIRPREKSDWWLVKNQLYDGSTLGLIEPVATRGGCRLKTITTTGYSG